MPSTIFWLSIASLLSAKDFNRTDLEMAFSITVTLAFHFVGAFYFPGFRQICPARHYSADARIDRDFSRSLRSQQLSRLTTPRSLRSRALFRNHAGGEWGAGASLTMEKVPARLRGVFSGLLNQGYSLGNLLAALCYFTLFQRWGWRPMFLLGGVPALLAVFIRLRVKESEVWEKTRAHDWGQLRHTILSHWKLFLCPGLLMMTFARQP